jgi:hypothetical protein
MPQDLEMVRATLDRARDGILERANVVAAGVGYKVTRGVRTDDLAIVASVTEKVPPERLAAHDLVPAAVDGIPTDVLATGEFRAFQSRMERHRPAPGGVSIGHRNVTAGTLGCLMRSSSSALSPGWGAAAWAWPSGRAGGRPA